MTLLDTTSHCVYSTVASFKSDFIVGYSNYVDKGEQKTVQDSSN